MTREQLIDKFTKHLTDFFTEEDIINYWNYDCDLVPNGDYYKVYDNDNDFFAIFYDDHKHMIDACMRGEYSIYDKYLCFDLHDTVTSFDELTERKSPIDLGDVSAYIVDNEPIELIEEFCGKYGIELDKNIVKFLRDRECDV